MITYRVFISLVIINFLAGCQSTPEQPPAPSSIEALTLNSDIVIVGKVLQNRSRWLNGHIMTTSDVQPLQTLKGKTGGATLQVSFYGGTVDNINEHVEHEATLQEGQISVMFLRQFNQKSGAVAPLSIVSEKGSIPLVQPWERESRLTNNRRLIRQLEDISLRVKNAGGLE